MAENQGMGLKSRISPDASRLPGSTASSSRGQTNRVLAWSVWLVCLIALLSFIPTLQQPRILDVADGLSWTVGVLAVATIGTLVASRQRSLVQGWLLVGFSVLWSAGLFIYNYLRLPGTDPSADLARAQHSIAVADTLIAIGIHALFLLLLLVPNGQLPSRRWRPVVWLVGVSAVIQIWTVTDQALRIVDIDTWLDRHTWVSTAGMAGGTIDSFFLVSNLAVGLLLIGLIVLSLWSRLGGAPSEMRQQVKWVVWGMAGIASWPLIWLPQPDEGWLVTVQRLYPGFALGLLAIGFGMALFKYRLWDIDLVVRRSLVYGVLWLLIAVVYAGVAAGFGLAAGARFPVGVAIGLTVAATLLFQPARSRLERIADRWVFGRTDTPAEVLYTFAEEVAASARPRDIASELVSTAEKALGLAWVTVTVDGSAAAEVGVRTPGPEVALPIARGEEHFGTIGCQPQRGVNLNDDDFALLEALVGQAALAMSHARLASRIVHAQERERRRLERNIHDGAQQDLATLVARLGVTRARANGDAALVDALDEIQQEVQRILGELRELAQGIHP
ncbi:MAG: histidine kinase dimerization/phosphoacceptor domain-containing protein, partial [Acidimicrobiia bacterium]